MKRFIKVAIVAAVTVVLAVALAGCGGDSKSVAATVNGDKIYEEDVTTYVEQMRTYYGCTEDADWATLLSTYGYEPSDIRKMAIDSLAQEDLVAKKADELGISVSDDDVSSQIQSIRDTYGYDDDDDWQSALEGVGYASEDDYKAALKASLVQEALLEKEVPEATPSESDIVSAASSYTGKRASGIKVADEATANDILAQLQASSDVAADFKTLYASSNTDTSYTGTDGDLGWTSVNYTVYYYYLSNIATALDSMNKGDLQVIADSTGTSYWVIYCTDSFEVADGVTLTKDMIPSDIYQTVTKSVTQSNWSTDCDTYLQSLVDDADIKINDMPDGLSYDVDMSLATTSSSTSGTTGTTSTTTSDTSSSSTSSTSGSTSSSSSSSTN